jgi:hypothetical protein
MIEEPRGHIDYRECGTGPTIVLVPGSCSTGAVWRPVIDTWNRQFRCVTTSLLGYGGRCRDPARPVLVRDPAADPVLHPARRCTDGSSPAERDGHPLPVQGQARYYSVKIGDKVVSDLVWTYPDPIPECPKIKGYLCFFNEQVDEIRVDGVAARPATPWSKGLEREGGDGAGQPRTGGSALNN